MGPLKSSKHSECTCAVALALGLPFDRRDQSLSAPIREAGVRSPPERQS
jgi:hypothetical protein